MKKMLSVFLALAITLGCAAGAAAVTPEDNGGLYAQGLNNPLQAITKLEAVWNGVMFYSWLYSPAFNADNVEVTLTYEDGETETLDGWHGSGDDWWWGISIEHDDDTGEVLVYYNDSNLSQAYWDSLGEDGEFVWADYLAALPQATFTVPKNIQQTQLAAVPALVLDVGCPVVLDMPSFQVFSFKPETSGLYRFYSYDCQGDPNAYLYDENFHYIDDSDDTYDEDDNFNYNFSIRAWLTAGETYYLSAQDYNFKPFSVMVTKASLPEEPVSGFGLTTSKHTIRYSTYDNIYPDLFIAYSEYGYYDILVNGYTLDYYFDWGVYVEGTAPGKVMTLTYTTLDGEALGTVDIVCEMSAAQWIAYYLLGGFIWMRTLPMVNARQIPYLGNMTGRLYENLMGLWRSLWYGKF